MKLRYCLMGILLPVMNAFAQNASEIKPLKVGDYFPAGMVNQITKSLLPNNSVAILKDKLLILDFMATTCKSCIAALPRFDSLQTLYGERMQIILVTYEEEDRVRTFFQKNVVGKKVKLPIVVKDTMLSKLFTHVYIPHEVWIKDGLVKAITSEQYVKAENIETVLGGKQIRWPVKRDVTEYNYSKHLMQLNAENIPVGSFPEQNFYAAFSAYLNDVPHRYSLLKDTLKKVIKISMINLPAIDLYISSYNLFRYPKGHILIEAKDKSKYIYDKTEGYKDEWKSKNTFCFEMVAPANISENKRQEKIRRELDFYLDMQGRIERRKVSSLIVVSTDTSFQNSPTNTPSPTLKGERTIPLSSLIYILNDNIYGTPVMNETGIKETTLLTLDAKIFSDIPLLQQALKKYGLDIITDDRETDMLVISEKNIQ